jgi:plastocyanin
VSALIVAAFPGRCADGGPTLSTAIESGPVQQVFTFTAPGPGRYGYWCIVHPNTMTGALIASNPRDVSL